MAFPTYPYPTYPSYYGQPMPDQLAQLRQSPMQPQMIPQQMAPQPMQQPAQQAQAQTGGIIWVGSKQEADNYPIAPGCAAALWDSNSPVIYLRQADSTGKPSTKTYDLVERTEAPSQKLATKIPDMSQYITREELESILSERLKKPARASKAKEEPDNE